MAEAAAASLELAAKAHLSHPFGDSTTSRISTERLSQDEASNRRLTGARARRIETAATPQTQTTNGRERAVRFGEKVRWAAYREVMGERFARANEEWVTRVIASSRRIEELLDWSAGRPCPRWRLIECWTVSAHGPQMATAGGFRLAFWSEDVEHHGPRLERALARYTRYAEARPPEWPEPPIAAFARFLTRHTRPQEGPEHGMAYDVQRFNELTKQMSAYAQYTRAEHLGLAARRARRRERLEELAAQVNERVRFRIPDAGPDTLLRRASALLDSEHPNHKTVGRGMYARALREQRLAERDRRLLASRHPGNTDGRYRAACAHAKRWGLPLPTHI